jgi:hypothetical protein
MPATRSAPAARFLILEMALVAFAIVLGFIVTNWDVARRDRGRARVAVERIRMEIGRNAAGLETAVPYYGEMSNRLDSILSDAGDRPVDSITIPGWRGLSPPSIRTASFQVATATGALEHVDFAIADEIALTYEVFEDFSASVDHALSTVIAGDLTRVSEWQVVFALLAELAAGARHQSTVVLEHLADAAAAR